MNNHETRPVLPGNGQPSPRPHDHVFGQDQPRPGERRTLIVIVLTAITMVVEIVAGIAYGSMALLADGLHMASHTAALALAAFAYAYARRHARDARFSFGTGKVNALAGFSGAIVLAGFALIMVFESVNRFLDPVDIIFNQAILVAVIGFVVNALSMVILGGHHENGHDHDHDHAHDHEDHNLRSAYLHVITDALTSVMAIAALLAGKYLELVWLDPVMGVVGAAVVIRWSWGLLRQSGKVLLDRQAPDAKLQQVREAIEKDGARVHDLHVWSIGPGYYAAEIVLEAQPVHDPDHYRALIPADLNIEHAAVEVWPAGS